MFTITDSRGTVLAGPFTTWKVAACYIDGIRKAGAPGAKITPPVAA